MKPDRRSYDAAHNAEDVHLAVERNNVTSVAVNTDSKFLISPIEKSPLLRCCI
jgi:hypothetical protein